MSALEMWKAIVISTVICICSKEVMSGLTVVPKNTVTKVGEIAYLNCSTNLLEKQIHWFHGGNYIYAGGSYFDPYIGRFKVETDSQGAFNLVIRLVEAGDAGTYMCQDDGGHGQKSSAELVAIENDLFCASNITQDEVIGLNSCGLKPELVNRTCSISYNGKFPPKMIWKRLEDSVTITESGDNVTITEDVQVTVYGKTVTSVLSFKASDLTKNEQSFVCETTQLLNLQYNCVTPIVKISYAFSNSTPLKSLIDEEIVCSANSNQNCSYIWKRLEAQDLQTVSSNNHLKPNKPGKYQCEAECPMKNMSCFIVSMVIEVEALALPSALPSPSSSSTSETPSWLWGVIVAVVLLIVSAIVIVLCFIRKRKLHKSKTHQKALSHVKLEINSPKEQQVLISQEANSDQKIKEDISEKEKKGNTEPVYLNTEPIYLNSVKEDSQEPNKATDVSKDQNIEKLSIWNITQGKTIRGLAVGDGKIYVLTNDPNYLETYGMNDHKTEGMRSLDNTIEQPFDIAYCPSYKRVYVMDGTVEGKKKNIVVLNQFGVKITSWNTEFDVGNLSVASDCCVVLAASRAIKEYLPDGKLIRLIEVHETIFPLCAIKVDTQEFLVSHGNTDGKVHEVCLVKISKSSPADKTCHVEKVEKSFGKKTESNSEQLNCPRNLALSENKDVFVLDEQNNRVLILNSDLKFKKELLLTEHGLQSPVKICLNESAQQLIVAGNSVDSNHSTEKIPGILVLTL